MVESKRERERDQALCCPFLLIDLNKCYIFVVKAEPNELHTHCTKVKEHDSTMLKYWPFSIHTKFDITLV